jgi:hypothetical protein
MKNKETTIEDAIGNWIDNNCDRTDGLETLSDAIRFGIKWQQERSYSDEEVEVLLETLSKVLVYQGNDYRLPHYFEFEIAELLKQFKKK